MQFFFIWHTISHLSFHLEPKKASFSKKVLTKLCEYMHLLMKEWSSYNIHMDINNENLEYIFNNCSEELQSI